MLLESEYILFCKLELKMRMKGLEPSRPEALEPKSSASANSATSALAYILYHKKIFFGKTTFSKIKILH